MPRQVLGRGLGALLNNQNPDSSPKADTTEEKPASEQSPPSVTSDVEPQQQPATTGESVVQVKVEFIIPSPLQPRKKFSEDSLKELADSIREKGILQPLIVRPSGKKGRLELIAGERRLRASKLAGLKEVPVLLRSSEDQSALEWMMVENLQREDLNPLDEAMGYKDLATNFKLKQEDIAKKVGKSRAAVSNSMRLLKLPEKVQDMLKSGSISVGHAKVLLGVDNADLALKSAEKISRDGLSVRQLEDWLQSAPGNNPSTRKIPPRSTPQVPPEIEDIENNLREKFATKVSVKYRDQKGSIEIKFFNHDDLDRIVHLLDINK